MNHPRLGLKFLIPRKRELHRDMTKAEQILWKQLRGNRFEGFKFRRQHGIGPYIVDFCAPKLKIVIEVDGDIHALPDQKAMDEVRQKEIEALNYKVLRYTNQEVLKNLEGVLQDLVEHLRKTSPCPPPL